MVAIASAFQSPLHLTLEHRDGSCYLQGGVEVVESYVQLEFVVGVGGYLDGELFEVCGRVDTVLVKCVGWRALEFRVERCDCIGLVFWE